MRLSNLAASIDAVDCGAGDHRRRKRLRRIFLRWLEAGTWGKNRPEWNRFLKREQVRTAFATWERAVEQHVEKLAKTIYAMATRRMPEATARKRYGALRTEIAAMRALAEHAGLEMGHFSRSLDPREVRWAAMVEEDLLEVHVIVTEQAMRDLLFVAAEGYRVPRSANRKGNSPDFTEVYGLCFGTISESHAAARWKQRKVFYAVERCVPQLRARMQPSSVTWNEESTRVQIEVARRLAPQWKLLGDFHSHPYRGAKRMNAAKGWQFSDQDQIVNRKFHRDMIKLGQKPVLGLVVAVAKKGKARTSARPQSNGACTFKFTHGRYDYVLGAYVNPVDHNYRGAYRLQCVVPAQ